MPESYHLTGVRSCGEVLFTVPDYAPGGSMLAPWDFGMIDASLSSPNQVLAERCPAARTPHSHDDLDQVEAERHRSRRRDRRARV
jgi:hypothetical protein